MIEANLALIIVLLFAILAIQTHGHWLSRVCCACAVMWAVLGMVKVLMGFIQ